MNVTCTGKKWQSSTVLNYSRSSCKVSGGLEALLFYFTWNRGHSWSFNNIDHSWSSTSLQGGRPGKGGERSRGKDGLNEFFFGGVFYITIYETLNPPQKTHSLTWTTHLTFSPDFFTQLYINFFLSPPFTSLSFSSFPCIFPSSFQFPLSLTHET